MKKYDKQCADHARNYLSHIQHLDAETMKGIDAEIARIKKGKDAKTKIK